MTTEHPSGTHGLDAWSALECGLPVPHEVSPAATARKGTRRIRTDIRRLVGRQLGRERALALMSSGELEDARARVVWKVGDAAVVQPVGEMSIPAPAHLVEPVRRVGTHEGAPSRIAMLPVTRENRALMLTLDSGVELAWSQMLDMHPHVTEVYAQPLMLVWEHAEGSIVHVPDLAALVSGRLVVFEVKPAALYADPWIGARTRLAQRTFARGGFTYQALGDVRRQRVINLLILSQYRRPNPFLAAEVSAALESDAKSVGGVIDAVCRFRMQSAGAAASVARASVRGRAARASDQLDVTALDLVTSMRFGTEVAMHLLASGHRHADLDGPLRMSTALSPNAPDISTWSAW